LKKMFQTKFIELILFYRVYLFTDLFTEKIYLLILSVSTLGVAKIRSRLL